MFQLLNISAAWTVGIVNYAVKMSGILGKVSFLTITFLFISLIYTYISQKYNIIITI